MPLFEILLPITSGFYWELDPFFHLFRKFWGSQVVAIMSDQNPNIDRTRLVGLRDATGESWGGKFSANLIGYLNDCKSPCVVILMADYWITERVNVNALRQLAKYMVAHPNVIRLQISNGMAAGKSDIVERWGMLEIRNRPEFLRGSLIPGMWSRDLLLRYVRGGWDLWTFEQEMSRIINATPEIQSYLVMPEIITYSHIVRTSARTINFSDFPANLRDEISGFVPGGFSIG